MNIAILTPGTGSYYCGACMRDNALAKSLHAAGHEVSLLPMYLPLQLDEEQLPTAGSPIFFGGINVFLQQKLPRLQLPRFLHKLLNNTSLLRSAAKRSHMTSARDHGEMALEMLRIEDSPFGQEMQQLIDWLARENPDILVLGTALQAGMIRTLRQHLDVKIICSFQGEDSFLDGLPEPYKTDCWNELTARLPDADLLISPSRFYADLMRCRLDLPHQAIEVLPNGVAPLQSDRELQLAPEPPPPSHAALPPEPPLSTSPSAEASAKEDHSPARHGPEGDGGALGTDAKRPVIGYFARMIREKGVHHLVEAFIHLRKKLDHPDARLHIAGAVTAGDEKLVADLKRQLADAGLTDQVTWSPNVSLEEKQQILHGFTVFSVPATYPEAFGLYLIEALAAGIPVVQPDGSSFREIIAQSEAGRLVEPNQPVALAEAWNELLSQPDELERLGTNGRRAANEYYSVEAMRDRFLALAEPLVDPGS
ncbi:glycosyltransferase family 4 protein [Haloferula rosea]|uniref:Glycosyltransferase family 4 protein n=1 Tax=Haloferula rosea TaxID=490093 RepID=A0A934VAX4_9BACT|nr:glycosyltransferase family 4 protein [Haloferula rosea]MBK1826788.1 glycosyltransferase family 4 protein [Haloferula rosea]